MAVSSSATDISLDELLAGRLLAERSAMKWTSGLTGVPGSQKTVRRGQGLEFDDLRPYTEGDDVRHIDWNVTARSLQPHIRLYREERERTLTVLLDLTAPMFTGTRELRAVTACQASAQIVWHAALSGARSAVVIFDGQSLHPMRPTLGEAGALVACTKIHDAFVQARNRASSQDVDDSDSIAALLDWVVQTRRSNGLSVLVSGMDDPGAQWEFKLAEAGRRHQLAVIWIRDHAEIHGLPAGTFNYKSANGSSRLVVLNRKDANRLKQQLADRAQSLQDACGSRRVPIVQHTSDDADSLFANLSRLQV